MNKIILLAVCIFTLLPVFAQAETVLRTGTDVSVDEEQVVEGDYYVSVGPFGRTVMSGSVSEDMYALGATVTVNGEIGHDVSILAGTSQIHAPVADDVRIFAGEATIAGDVGGDVFVLASSLSILSTAHVTGDVFFFGGDLLIEGDLDGSVRGKAQSVTVDSYVMGDIDVSAPLGLTLGDNAVIDGSVKYTSFIPLNRGQGTVINGEVLQTESAVVTSQQKARDMLIPIFITLFATLSLYLLFKRELENIVSSTEASFSRNLLLGSAMVLLGPVVAVLLMVTVLGLFVGLIALSLVVLLYVAGISLSSIVLGTFIMRLITKKLEVTLVAILLGTAAVQLLVLIPVVGPLTLYVVFAVTVGALTQRVYRTISL